MCYMYVSTYISMSSNTHWQGAIQIITTGQLDFSGNMITSRTDNANFHGNLCTLSFYLQLHYNYYSYRET